MSAGENATIRERFGRLLFDRLFDGSVRDVWRESVGRASAVADRRIRLRLWIDSPELAALPWELLHDGKDFLYGFRAAFALSLGGGAARLEQDPARKAGYLDQAIAEYEAGMQLDLNDYYPGSNLPRVYRARNDEDDEQKARVAAAVTAVACERARAKGGKDQWLKPTLLGAAFDAGDVARAKQLAKEVLREGAAAWQLATTLTECKTAAELHGEPSRSKLLAILSLANS